MNLNQFKEQFSNETLCRKFFESIRWPSGRICPHCGHAKSWVIRAAANRPQRYECANCELQFTVTTKTALHATKLPLSTWLLAMYLITSSSKGLASTVLARLIGTTQPTAWKMGHTVRKMMDSSCSDALLLKGIVELDETYVGGKPAKVPGVRHKRGKGTSKQ
jgi:transposase-like protein